MNKFIVTESSGNIKYLTRQTLEGNWKKATLAIVIYTVCISVPVFIFEILFGSLNPETIAEMAATTYTGTDVTATSLTSTFLSYLYMLLVGGAFTLGVCKYFLQLVRFRQHDLGNVFSGFSQYFKAFALYFMVNLFILLWACLFIVPGIIAAFRYSQAYFILADDPEKGVMQCIRESKELMKGNKSKLFCLELSFIGWVLLASLVYFIAVVVAVVVAILIPDAFAVAMIVLAIGVIAFMVFACIIEVYLYGATVVFYDMVIGNLRSANNMPEGVKLY